MKPEIRDDKIATMMQEDLKLLQSKGADYAGVVDALKNFRRHGIKGILVRMGDKYDRLDTLIWGEKDPTVKEESILDTARDLRIYAYLLELVYKDTLPKKEPAVLSEIHCLMCDSLVTMETGRGYVCPKCGVIAWNACYIPNTAGGKCGGGGGSTSSQLSEEEKGFYDPGKPPEYTCPTCHSSIYVEFAGGIPVYHCPTCGQIEMTGMGNRDSKVLR